MKVKSLVGFSCFLLFGFSLLRADSDFKMETPHPELYRTPENPIGTLGLPLGTFAVIEGIQYDQGMTAGIHHGFLVESVNGKKTDGKVGTLTDWPNSLPVHNNTGHHYVLHGYESASWGGQPNIPRNENWGAQVIFGIYPRFVVTSVEKVDGVIANGAKPLDPKIPLAEPQFEKRLKSHYCTKPPIGMLGMPLGTFAIITARTPRKPSLMESPFEVTVVNGTKLDPPVIISIPNVKSTNGDEVLTIHGFETGEWTSQPDLPDSEYSHSLPQPQKPFQYFPHFVVTSLPKTGP